MAALNAYGPRTGTRRSAGKFPRCVDITAQEWTGSLLNPHNSLKWQECSEAPFQTNDPQAVIIDGRLYMGGGWARNSENSTSISVYDCISGCWEILYDCPVAYFGMAAYCGNLLLAGGERTDTLKTTDEIYIWDVNRHLWGKPIPHMLMCRKFPSAVSKCQYIAVAGGEICGRLLDTVEVYNGQQWLSTNPIPKPAAQIKHTYNNDCWFMVSEKSTWYAFMEDLVEASEFDGYEQEEHSCWQCLPEVPFVQCSIATFGSCLLLVGGWETGASLDLTKQLKDTRQSSILAYFPRTFTSHSWVHVADLPLPRIHHVSVVFPTGELGVAAGETNPCNYDLSLVKASLCQDPSHVDNLQSEPQGHSFLRGVDVIASTRICLRGEKGHSYEWTDYGLKLHVPPNAFHMHEIDKECKVYIKASCAGFFELPDNCELVSGVYWIASIENFDKKVTLEIQHCVSLDTTTDTSSMSFVVASCTQPVLPYKFDFLRGGSFHHRSGYGSISLSHFCGLGIVRRKKECSTPLKCCSKVYYINESSRSVGRWKLDFVVIKDLQVCIQAVQNRYLSTAREGASQIIHFEDDELCLEVPHDGIEHNEWVIRAIWYPPKIFKKDVGCFKPGQEIPKCSLRLRGRGSPGALCELLYELKLTGTKTPKSFLIDLDPTDQYQSIKAPSSMDTVLSVGTQNPLALHQIDTCAQLQDEPSLVDLLNNVAARIPNKWKRIGIELGITADELDFLAQASNDDFSSRYTAVFNIWKRRLLYPYTWEVIINILAKPHVDESKLAETLKLQLRQ